MMAVTVAIALLLPLSDLWLPCLGSNGSANTTMANQVGGDGCRDERIGSVDDDAVEEENAWRNRQNVCIRGRALTSVLSDVLVAV
jgi:hypothetical protein